MIWLLKWDKFTFRLSVHNLNYLGTGKTWSEIIFIQYQGNFKTSFGYHMSEGILETRLNRLAKLLRSEKHEWGTELLSLVKRVSK